MTESEETSRWGARLPFLLLVGSPLLALAITFAFFVIDRKAGGAVFGRTSEVVLVSVNAAIAAGGAGASVFLSRRSTAARVGLGLFGAACGILLYGLLAALAVVAISFYDAARSPPTRVIPPPPGASATGRRTP